MKMKCQGPEDDIYNCYRELAMGCSHESDVLIECSMIDFSKPREPETGTVRLMNEKGGVAANGKGRLEMFQGKWGSVCHEKFNPKSAQVACK